MTAVDPLPTRLFGYGILYQGHLDGDGPDAACEPVDVTAADEARALARELRHHLGAAEADEAGTAAAAISVPFGRCGIRGRPLEHVRLFHAAEAWVDSLTPEGPRSRPVGEGETILVEPGAVVRFRARPRPGRRVVVAFQTEDRSPLHGHAAPLSTTGQTVPSAAAERLEQTTAAFADLWTAADSPSQLAAFLARMADAVAGDAAVEAAQDAARAAGSYAAGGDDALFARAQALLTPAVLARIEAGDEAVFRFPGMFGAVAPLFPLLDGG